MIYAVIDTNVIVSALLLVTGNLKHFPATPKVISPAEMVAIIEHDILES